MKKVKGAIADIKITYSGQKNYRNFKKLAESFNKVQEISGKMCQLRQSVIDLAIDWEKYDTLQSAKVLAVAVKMYTNFKKKHFPEKKK